jgi:hypothetical protein
MTLTKFPVGLVRYGMQLYRDDHMRFVIRCFSIEPHNYCKDGLCVVYNVVQYRS